MYPQVEQNLKHIISVIERMTQLISELKAFASRHRVPKGSADVIKVCIAPWRYLITAWRKITLSDE